VFNVAFHLETLKYQVHFTWGQWMNSKGRKFNITKPRDWSQWAQPLKYAAYSLDSQVIYTD